MRTEVKLASQSACCMCVDMGFRSLLRVVQLTPTFGTGLSLESGLLTTALAFEFAGGLPGSTERDTGVHLRCRSHRLQIPLGVHSSVADLLRYFRSMQL